jgi:hypothetical protein
MELSFKLDRDKVTKNKVVYREVTRGTEKGAIETLYIRKEHAAQLGNPDNLKVTVTAK